MTGSEALAAATRALTAAGIPDAGRDARRLLAHVLKVPAGRLTLFLPEPVPPDLGVIYNVLIERRCERVPVSHLTGRRLFYGRDFLVTPEVLDPRPETETLIEAALAAPFANVLDLGTGSGCIVLTLVAETPGSRGMGVDISPEALNVAYWNRNALRLEDRVRLATGHWYEAVDPPGSRFDLVVSNPPYIARVEMPDLAPEVRDHEPALALTDGADGLSAYRAIAAGAAAHLLPGGRLLVEIGPTQATEVTAILAAQGLHKLRVIPDLDGRDRVLQAVLPGG
ncbi:peptide chain release factor N(5)-glutamine methyltransferase [Thalassococcus profundi]|uniref:Release factor glutamine methyltransferase n=1 Tax=Thalassococcus profundi TaxID=2282382 RepID=A0A369TQ54_9RHOB|nr:peptide chain release factor N(5)-glutamine methyltransferase [Thalassococcus profundi]RDD67411.1 peptide chain release factor N(5)-glutamine methyltransferase [Thalassococcus profundi]